MTGRPETRVRGGSAQTVLALSALTVTVGLATVAAWPIYGTARLLFVALAGLVIGAGAVLGAKALRWPGIGAWGLLIGGYLLAVVPLAVPSSLTDPGRAARGLVAGVTGIVTGWKQLLTVSLPASSYQGVLVPFLVTIALGSFLATAAFVRRDKLTPLAVVPMLAMVAFGAIFGSDATGTDLKLGPLTVPAPLHVLVGSLAVIVSLTWLIGSARVDRAAALRLARSRTSTVRQSGESRALMVRRQLVSALLVLGASGAAIGLAPVASELGKREVLREDIDPLLVLQQQPSPLSTYRSNFTVDGFDQELFSIDGDVEAGRIRIATLDQYDGQTFFAGAVTDEPQFVREPTIQDDAVKITIGEGLTGVWVPVVEADSGAPLFTGERAEELEDGYFASESLGAAVVVTDQSGQGIGLIPGDTYFVAAGQAPGEPTRFASATGADPLISGEEFPALALWVETQELGRSGADLMEMVSRLRERGYLSHSATQSGQAESWIGALESSSAYVFEASRSGHSAARIEELFTALVEQERRAGPSADQELLIAAVGDDEQFAAAAALLANYLGFQSRVVIGVRVGDAEEGLGVAPCNDVCTGANVTAWVEVRSGDGEWVALDVTPQFETVPSRIKEGERPPQNPTVVERPGSDVQEPPAALNEGTETQAENQDDPLPEPNPVIAWVGAALTGLLAITLLVLPVLIFPIAKALRRAWRRHSGVPEVSMVGAWDELLDSYIDHGIDVPRRLTRAETADVLGRPGAATLASVVDRAVFAEHPPTREAAEATWELLKEEKRLAAAALPLGRRIRASLTADSLLRAMREPKQSTYSTHLTGRTHHVL